MPTPADPLEDASALPGEPELRIVAPFINQTESRPPTCRQIRIVQRSAVICNVAPAASARPVTVSIFGY